ncbi:MAG: hypothetical protein AAF556_08715, partial [Pseudomonadota bacterium]
AETVAAHLAADPEHTAKMLSNVAEGLDDLADTLWDRAEMWADVETPLAVDAPTLEGTPSAAETALATAQLKANKARERTFAEGREKNVHGTDLQPEIYYVDRLKPAAEALGRFASSIRQGEAPTKAAAALTEALATKLQPDTLVRLADTLPVNYRAPLRDRANQRREGWVAQLSAVDLAMRHWGEVNASGRFTGGISIRNGQFRAIPAAVVEAQGVRVNDRADFEAVTSKPPAKPSPRPDDQAARPKR